MSDRTYPLPHVTLDWLNKRAEGTLPHLLGVTAVEVAERRVVCRMDVTPKHIAPNGYLHAASVIALADTTCGYATVAHLPEGARAMTTIELKSNFLGTCREGAVRATATAKHLGGMTHVWDAEVTREDDGKAIALFRCTQMILK